MEEKILLLENNIKTKIVYTYDNEGYYTGSLQLDNTDICQLTGNFIIPAMATDKKVLEKKEGYKIKFNFDIQDWEYEKILSLKEKKIKGLIELDEGEIIQENKIIKIEKPNEFYSWDYKNKKWYFDNLKKEKKINEIKNKAYLEITEKYPYYKQLNIIRNKDVNEDTLKLFLELSSFIDEIRAHCENEIMNLPKGDETNE